MEVGKIYNMQLGKYNANYLVIGVDEITNKIRLRIFDLPKTKVGQLRTPEYITIKNK